MTKKQAIGMSIGSVQVGRPELRFLEVTDGGSVHYEVTAEVQPYWGAEPTGEPYIFTRGLTPDTAERRAELQEWWSSSGGQIYRTEDWLRYYK